MRQLDERQERDEIKVTLATLSRILIHQPVQPIEAHTFYLLGCVT